MNRRICVLLCCTLVALFARATGGPPEPMSQEEIVVRQTYAKLSFATQLGTIHSAIRSGKNASAGEILAAGTLRFNLDNFVTGDLKDISQRFYGEFVTKPVGDQLLQIAPGTFKYTNDADETVEQMASVRWAAGQDLSSQDWHIPVEKALALMEDGQDYSRYACFTATVSFEGQSRTYRGLFLFGKEKGTGTEKVLAIDTVAGNAAVTYFINHSVYPSVLLETKLRSHPIVAKWLATKQNPDASCKAGVRQACCDPKTVTCSIAADDMLTSATKPASRMRAPGASPVPRLDRALRARLELTALKIPRVNAFLGDCADYSYATGPYPYGDVGTYQHYNGAHNFAAGFWGACDYSGDTGTCSAHASASTSAAISDTGAVSGFPFPCHVPGYNTASGEADGTAPSAKSIAAAAVKNCQLCLCGVTISISPLSFPPDAVYQNSHEYTITCASRNNSPIVVDTDGKGFQLTSARDGVMFDFRGDGQIRTGWTQQGSRNGFLALDRNNNGVIDNGLELFGNYTIQPSSDDPNGFLALALFDTPGLGGNGNGVIDPNDAIWIQLRIWIDENHDGVSQPGELLTLKDVGIQGIDLKYHETRRKDQYGNLFRYQGTLVPGSGQTGRLDKKIYDVFLTQ